MTLAGLRPGRDAALRAGELYDEKFARSDVRDGQVAWIDDCRKRVLTIDTDASKKIQVIHVTHEEFMRDCVPQPPSPWKTGRGLRVGDPAAKVVQLYGEPDSRSPSTKDGQPLELWYYAFDWAGPHVPQVIEVLCTKEQGGKPGYVVEITLAAPSL